ncbi:MAG TPA: hypothetical protein VFG76_03600, partial [Candidatus Polarisedimenticolia bacterium]|nr:hypothetical protein [Candidatus Polarisedimenticolia bacterium]
SDFRADTYDTVEFAYFPNISPLFGGPFLSPDAFGEQVGSDAFANFAFGTVAFELAPGVTYLIEMTHDSATRRLTARVSSVDKDGRAVPVEGGAAVVDLSPLSGFLVNSLGISAYHDGFNIFSTSGRSLLATVDYEMLYSGLATDGRLPNSLERMLRRFRHGLAHTRGPGPIVVP